MAISVSGLNISQPLYAPPHSCIPELIHSVQVTDNISKQLIFIYVEKKSLAV